MKIDKRLEDLKNWKRAMQSYVLTLHEIIYEIKPEYVLEIGTQYGQSTKSILLALKENNFGKLISVDHKKRQDILDNDYTDLKDYWNFIQGSSHDNTTINNVKNLLPENKLFDVAFIDGDHTYDGVKADFNDYYNLIKPGGLIILHDVINKNEGVKEFWEEIKDEKFSFWWGKAQNSIIPGLGFVKKIAN